MKLRLRFASAPLEKEYKKVKRAYMRSFFKFLVYILIILCGIGTIQNVIIGSLDGFLRMSIILLISAVVLKYGHKMERFSDFLLSLLCFALYLSGIFSTADSFGSPSTRDSTFFYRGYVYGFFERLVVFQLARIELKVAFSIASLVLRLVVCTPPNTFTLCYQILMWALGLLADIRREGSDRAVFKGFYENREELTKFKNLMESGLPTNILIIAKDTQRRLFGNECFENTFQLEGVDNRWTATQWLDEIQIDVDSLDDRGRNAINQEEISSGLSLGKFIGYLNNTEFEINLGESFSFNAKTTLDFNREEKVFETKVLSLIWDSKSAIAIIMNDVTQQYTNLSLKVANTNKDKMLAMVSHEFRTPLNGILGMIQIIEKTIKDSEILKYLRVCKVNGQLLLSLVNSILDLSQIRSNKLKLNISKCVLSELFQEISLLFEFQFGEKNLFFEVEGENNLPTTIITDHNRLRQILINLIGNALKFTFKGGVRVHASLSDDYEDCMLFKVSDTGIGIKDEDKKKLFQMYGRLDQADSSVNIEGVGLGLTISNHLVKLLANDEDADIKVDSVPGEGTTFSFRVKTDLLSNSEEINLVKLKTDVSESSLCAEEGNDIFRKIFCHVLETKSSDSLSNIVPNARLSCQADTHASMMRLLTDNEEESTSKKTQDNGHVLLVDDSPFNIMVARHLIEGLGYQVKTALNGKIALDIVKEAVTNGITFKIVFMDCQMPVMDGFEATSVLISLMAEGEIPEIPIVALSANDSEDDKRRCQEVGMRDHLVKPVTETSLNIALKKYCK